MTFEELPLFDAIYSAYREVENPRSTNWYIQRREELCRKVQQYLPIGSSFSAVQILSAFDLYGKSPHHESGTKRIEFTVLVARTHGRSCFFANRGKGACSGEVTVDRVVPGSRGGLYELANCLIACSFHNTQRNDRTLEEYLDSSLRGCRRPS